MTASLITPQALTAVLLVGWVGGASELAVAVVMVLGGWLGVA